MFRLLTGRLTLVSVTFACASAALAAEYRPPHKELPFTVYTNAPIGRQLSGQHAPASSPPLSPEEAQRRFTLPEGFEIRLFASEPEVVNPVAMTWDERGRLWVLELYEYPLGAKPGTKGRDRIKILEDTDADGRADKVHVWADGLSLATGLLLGRGGAFVGQAPELLFLSDSDGDDRADKAEVIKTGFGLEDRHELLNGFAWGPDGQMYMTHGVFTRSSVASPGATNAEPPVLLTAGVARLNVDTRRFEIYSEGTSNPWGVDFDGAGNAFVSACVIEHLFHLVPGGLYDRQAGTPPHPYAYELLHSINDHKHHMAAYAGIQVYQGNQFPGDNAGTILEGNIHDNAVHQDRLKPNGSSFVASKWRDLVRANDGWFMPVSTQVGPDGAVWIMDWYDRYPCYQNANADPAGVDREHGRIWRVVHTGTEKGRPVPSRPAADMNLAKLGSDGLVSLLEHPNAWQRRMAQRLLSERRDAGATERLQNLAAAGAPNTEPGKRNARIAAWWSLYSSGALTEKALVKAAGDSDPVIRAWTARFIGERQIGSDAEMEVLARLGADPDPTVRLAVAVACRQFTSDHLTVNRQPRKPDAAVGQAFVALITQSADARDAVIPFMLWMGAEPLVAKEPGGALTWLTENGTKYLPLSGQIAAKVMRRLCDLGAPDSMDLAMLFIDGIATDSPVLAEAALDGLIKGQEGKALLPAKPIGPFIAKLSSSQRRSLAERGQKLGALWGDAAALRAVLARVTDANVGADERVRGIQTLRKSRSEATRSALMGTLAGSTPEAVQLEALAALGELGGDDVPEELLRRWQGMSPAARRAAAATLSSRRRWALPLLAQVRAGTISASDFGAPVVRMLMQNKDDTVREEAKAAIGRFRESGADKTALVAARRKLVLAADPDLNAGHEVAKKSCLVCHKLHGEGENVGPDLTGVGRSSLDALLWNIIDPNQVIGAGYEQVEVETRDDRVVAGRLIENTDTRVRLLLQGGKEEVLAKPDIKSQRTLESSVMPEGLEQIPEADFRNLIWYILAPPQEGPLTREKRERLISVGGHGSGSASVEPAPRLDRESVALWNPQWRVSAPETRGTPVRLPDFQGRANVLQTHPSTDRAQPAALERLVEIPAGRATTLRFAVAAHDRGAWRLRVVADGRVVREELIGHDGPRWRTVSVDLTPWSGRSIPVRLENAPADGAFEFGYWADLEIGDRDLAAR